MKKTVIHIMIVIGIFAFGSLMGQNSPFDLWLNADTDDFATIQQNVENYFADKDKEARGSGYKQWKRWEYINQNRLSNDGKVINYSAKNFEEYQASTGNSGSRYTTYGYWQSEGPTGYVDGWGWNGGIGRVNCITFHPTIASTFWVGCPSGGLWKTTNGGTTWSPLTDGMPRIGVSSMVINYNNTDHMYLLTGDGDAGDVMSIGVLKTLDGGETWENTGFSVNVTQNYRYYKLLMHPTNPNIMLAVGNAGILKTTDAWATYTTVLTVPSGQTAFYDIEFKPGDPSIVYACTKTRFYQSTNTGSSWSWITQAGVLPTNATRMAIGVTPDMPAYVYLFAGPSYSNGTYVGLFLSVNNGVSGSWQTRSTTPNILGYSSTGSDDADQTWYDHSIAISGTDEADVMTGGINCWFNPLWGWTGNWTLTSMWNNPPGTAYTHSDIHALEVNPLNNYLYCGSDGGIFVCTNFGGANTWTDLTAGLAITQNYRIAGYEPTLNLIINGTQDNGSNKWTGGTTMLHTLGADGMDCMIDHSNPNILYNSTQYGGLQKSTNGGVSYSGIQPAGSSGSWITPYVMHATNPNIIYGGYQDIYMSTNGGASWTNQGYTGSGAMALGGPSNPNRVYATPDGSSTLYMSNNGGASYTTLYTLPSGSVSFIAVNPSNSYDVFVTFFGYTAGQKVYRSTNAGTSWTNISGSLPNIPINCIAYENTGGSPNDALYIGTDVGVYYRDDDIGDWIPFMNGMPATMVFDLEINETSGYIMAGTYGRGFWRSQTYGDCYDLLLTQVNDPSNPNYTGFQHYEAPSYIYSSRIITGGIGTDVFYQAGDSIIMQTGFHAKAGNKFLATLGPCDGTGPAPPLHLSGVYVGSEMAYDDDNFVENWDILGEDELGNNNQELLMNVYPNPFSNTITITYESIHTGKAEVSIYNQLGVLIEHVIQESFAGGEQYVWQAVDIPNGVFFVQVKIGQEIARKKILKLN